MNEQEKYQLRTLVAKRLRLAGAEKVELVVLPTMKPQIERVSCTRKAQFEANIEEAFHARMDRKKVPKTPTSLDDASIDEVCRTCGGACCKSGEDHAYLTKAVLSRVQVEQKMANKTSLLKSYLDRIPEVAYAGSCIYHGTKGCALPRSMRSETCNRYLCYPVKQLGRSFASPGYAQLAVSNVKDEEERMVLLRDGETQELHPERWKPESP